MIIDVSHPCWTGEGEDFDHNWTIETWDQGDPSTPYFQSGLSRVCLTCEEVDEEWSGYEDDDY